MNTGTHVLISDDPQIAQYTGEPVELLYPLTFTPHDIGFCRWIWVRCVEHPEQPEFYATLAELERIRP